VRMRPCGMVSASLICTGTPLTTGRSCLVQRSPYVAAGIAHYSQSEQPVDTISSHNSHRVVLQESFLQKLTTFRLFVLQCVDRQHSCARIPAQLCLQRWTIWARRRTWSSIRTESREQWMISLCLSSCLRKYEADSFFLILSLVDSLRRIDYFLTYLLILCRLELMQQWTWGPRRNHCKTFFILIQQTDFVKLFSNVTARLVFNAKNEPSNVLVHLFHDNIDSSSFNIESICSWGSRSRNVVKNHYTRIYLLFSVSFRWDCRDWAFIAQPSDRDARDRVGADTVVRNHVGM